VRVVGLDLSLTATGWAVADGRHVEVGRITSKPAGGHVAARSVRLRRIAGQVHELAAGADLVLVEAPAFAATTGHAHDRSGLWWLVVARLTGAGVPLVEVPPSTLKTFATGKGNADKDAVLVAAVRTFPAVPVRDNNDADALWLAALGARAAGAPIDPWPVLPKDRARALAKLAGLPMEGHTHA
jgi:crossover junction endodeoxyribonuclease RuvC